MRAARQILGLWLACAAAALFILLICFKIVPAAAHDALTGWSYDEDCCSGKDCHHIPDEAVVETKDSFIVTVTPDIHPMVMRQHVWTIAKDNPKIRSSRDWSYHICISQEFWDGRLGDTPYYGGNLLCFYRKEGAV